MYGLEGQVTEKMNEEEFFSVISMNRSRFDNGLKAMADQVLKAMMNYTAKDLTEASKHDSEVLFVREFFDFLTNRFCDIMKEENRIAQSQTEKEVLEEMGI
jgi:hypothetical protein